MSLSQRIDAIVADAIGRRVFPGAVVVIAKDHALLHQAAYGTTMYDAPGSRPVDLATIYDIASLTKMFTATAALRLSDADELDIHAPVATYLPDFRPRDITIWHLLTHTSGLDIRLSALRQAGRAGLLEAVYRAIPIRAPGTSVAYSNVNSLLLGEIVARLCGMPLDDALDRLVLGPLRLRDTLFRPPAGLLPRIAPTELDQEWRGTLVHGSVHDESTHALGGVAGHAGLFSSAADLLVFCRMWLDDLLSLEADTGMDRAQLIEERHRPLSPAPVLLRRETIRLACTNQTSRSERRVRPGLDAGSPQFYGRCASRDVWAHWLYRSGDDYCPAAQADSHAAEQSCLPAAPPI